MAANIFVDIAGTYDLSKVTLKYEQSDEYIINNIKNEHLGYFLITAADLMARSSGLRPII